MGDAAAGASADRHWKNRAMNTVDLLILLVVAFNAILGAVRGAVWQVLRVGAIVLGVLVALRYGEPFLAVIPESLGVPRDTAGVILAQVVLFVSVYLGMYGLTSMAKALIDKMKLGSADRLLGALLGAAKGVLFCGVALYLQFTPLVEIDFVRDHLRGNIEKGIEPSRANRLFLVYLKDRIDELLPDSVEDDVRRARDRVSDAVVPR